MEIAALIVSIVTCVCMIIFEILKITLKNNS